jgi:hypothetical protein
MDFMDAYDELDSELLYIHSLMLAAVCATEHRLDDRVFLDLIWIAEKKATAGRELLKTMHLEVSGSWCLLHTLSYSISY